MRKSLLMGFELSIRYRLATAALAPKKTRAFLLASPARSIRDRQGRREWQEAICRGKPSTSSSPARARPAARSRRGFRSRAATGCCCSRPAGATAIPGSTSRSATTSSTRTTRYNWKFESEPVAGLNGRTSYQPRGKMLGGTSSLNGMVYMRGTPADYDGWRQRGCEGWDYASVLPFFRKAEDQERGENEFHGVGGPLKVSDQPLPQRDHRRRHRGGRAGGHPAQRRLQRRDAGGRRLLPGDDRQRPALERGGRLSEAGAQPQEPRRHAERARDPHPDRGRPRRRRRVPHAAGPRDGALPRRGDRLGRRLWLAATAAAVGHRAGRASAGRWASPSCATCPRSAPTCTTTSIPTSPGARPRPSRSTISPRSPVAQARRPASSMRSAATGRSPAPARSPASSCARDPRFDRPDLQINIFLWSIEKRDRDGIYPHKWPGFIDLAGAPAARGARPREPQEPRSAAPAEDRVQVPRDRLRHGRHALRHAARAEDRRAAGAQALHRRGGAAGTGGDERRGR